MNNDPNGKKPQDNKPQNNDDGRQGRRIVFLMVAALIATLLINSVYTSIANAYLSEIPYNEFQEYLDKDEIAELEFQSDRIVILTREEAKKPAAQQSAQWVAVDLGLSVKWCNMNVGASAPEDCGGYYSWGETKQKDYYADSTYLYTDEL